MGAQVFGTVGKSKVIKLNAELRYGGELVISGTGSNKLKGSELKLSLTEYEISLSETGEEDATYLEFKPITDKRAIHVTFVGGLYEMRSWQRRIR